MVKVAIVGASGYTGVELIRLLHRHPQVKITCLTSRQNTGEEISQVFPSLLGEVPLVCDPVETALVNEKADVIFTCLPHKTAMEVVPDFLTAGKKVVDLSADFRLKNVTTYEAWYQSHSCPELLGKAVYGLPELYRDQIRQTDLVANPGCYPTSVALGLAPLLKSGWIDPETIVIDSKSGTSGAGRSAKIASLFCEVNESFKAYGIGNHRHTPEIEQTLTDLAGKDIVVNFTPHLLPINRGILSTCYATSTSKKTTSDLVDLYNDFYKNEMFVRIHPEGQFPDVAFVRGSNFCNIGVLSDDRTGRIIVVSVIDNLVKGAAGQAVQNMNIMLGFDETLGLETLPLFP